MSHWTKIKLEEGEEPKDVPAEGEKKEDEREEKVVEEKEKSEAVEPKEEENPNLIAYLQPFVQFMRWDHADAEYFIKEIHNKNIMAQEDENNALSEMLQSYVDMKAAQQQKKPGPVPASRRGASPATNRGRGRPAPERGPSTGPDLAVVGEKRSKNPGSGGYIVDKIDDDIILS